MNADEIAAARRIAHQLAYVYPIGIMGLEAQDLMQVALLSIWKNGHSLPTAVGEHRTNSLQRLARLGVITYLRNAIGRRRGQKVQPLFYGDDYWSELRDDWTPERSLQLKRSLLALEGRPAVIAEMSAMGHEDTDIAATCGVTATRIGQQRRELRDHFAEHL